MSEVAIAPNSVSAATLEHVLGTGDLSKLSVQQRVEFYGKTCASLGLNPLTRPFRFLSFQGQTVMYATRDATDQLRALRKISIRITDQRLDGDLFIVTAQASTPDGRHDEDIGAVTMGKLMGDSRANATMRAMTKAKRRVTLSIVGLGMLSEDELDTMPGATTFDAEAEPDPPPEQETKPPAKATTTNGNDTRTKAQWDVWLGKLRDLVKTAKHPSEVDVIAGRPAVADKLADPATPPWVKREIGAVLVEGHARFMTPVTTIDNDPAHTAAPDADNHPDGGPRIAGEQHAAA